MKVAIGHNMPQFQAALRQQIPKGRTAVREALNRTLDHAGDAVEADMRRVFDRPVPFTLRSLKRIYANTANLQAILWFKQRSADQDKLWAVPQVRGGERDPKPMELRLQRAGILPRGWLVVPGAAMPLNAFGNMSQGEVSRILNVLGTYREAGYNKANAATVKRLRKGNAKKGQYGFEYWINPADSRRQKHLPPGVYRRVYTAYGTSLKPMLIFVPRARYRMRLDFFGIVERTSRLRFDAEFNKALSSLRLTGSASGRRVEQGGFQPRQRGLLEPRGRT